MQRLYHLLDEYDLHTGADAKAAEQGIWDTFGVNCAALTLDMSGFSRMTRRFGIVHYLALVRRMQKTTAPLVAAWRGEVVKYEADNLFAIFPNAEDAVRCALAIHASFAASNVITSEDRDIHVSIGIAWGRILVVPGRDFFGDAVNVACKLGEDLAAADQTLIDDGLRDHLPAQFDGVALEPVEFSVSGLTLHAWYVAGA